MNVRIKSYTAGLDDLRHLLERELQTLKHNPLRVLEAGGGSATFLMELEIDCRFTTIDISQDQLDRNTYATEKILGDLEVFDYGARRFDVVVCWDVLEHLKHPERALSRLISALECPGLILVKGPIPQSMKGIITGMSPHWFHVLFYRWVLKSRAAGQPGHAPFRTEHTRSARPEVIRDTVVASGLKTVWYLELESNHIGWLRDKSELLYQVFRLTAVTLQYLTSGRYGGIASDFVLVARR